MGLLDGDLATVINDALGPILMRDVVLTQHSSRAYDGATGTYTGSPTLVVVNSKGCRLDFNKSPLKPNQIVADTKLIIVILQKSMVLASDGSAFTGEPKFQDTVDIDGDTWTVCAPAIQDPAGASWVLQLG